MKNHKIIVLLLLFVAVKFADGQIKKDSVGIISSCAGSSDPRTIETRELFDRKGTGFVYWGYNRAAYGNSDIRFWGDGYDFSINNVRATDQPVTNVLTYIKPSTISVPQFNFRLGYYLNDKTFLMLGWDHMKYGIVKQTTHLTGQVTKDNNEGKNIGTYSNTEVEVGESDETRPYGVSIMDSLPHGFVAAFEHCDGLNDVAIEIGRIEQLWMSCNRRDALSVVGSIGFGGVVPDSDADVLGYPPKHDMDGGKKAFHLAGYSFSASIGLQFDFFKHFFLQGRVRAGYINLPDINTTTTGGRASQHFDYIEPMLVLGYTHSICKK